MNSRNALLLVILCGMLILILPGPNTTPTTETISINKPGKIVAQTAHDPIVITSNQDFIDQGWPGDGSEVKPYLIDHLHITNDSVCINITNTTVHFEIHDCIIDSVSSTSNNHGIIFDNVTFGSIYSSSITTRNYGVHLTDSFNCTLFNNTASSNRYGIYLSDSANNTLTENAASSNECDGFYLLRSDTNILTNNTASSNDWNGFVLSNSDSCTLTENTASLNELAGFSFSNSDSCSLQNNIASSNNNGFFILDSQSSTLLENTADSNDLSGLHLDNSDQSILMYNSISSNNGAGLYLRSSSNCILTTNTIHANADGVYIDISPNCILTNNSASSNGNGFYFDSSNNCNLTDNSAKSNNHGIYLVSSNYCNLTNNIASSNNWEGIRLQSSDQCELTNNTCSSNGNRGIYLRISDQCELTNNTANSNDDDGIYLYSSLNCILENNSANSNFGYGFYLDSSSNCIFANNSASSNSVGFYLVSSNYCNLTENFASFNDNYGLCCHSSSSVLTNNTAISNGDKGIYISSSPLCNLTNNIASSNNMEGIRLHSSDQCKLVNNTSNSNDDQGIYLYFSDQCELTNNTVISNGFKGIHLYYSLYTILENNTADSNTQQGFHLDSSHNCTLENNTANSNTLQGFYLDSSLSCNITDNIASSNSQSGFRLTSSDSCVLTSNLAISNYIHGFYLDSSTNCSLVSNILVGNGLYLQGTCEDWIHSMENNIVDGGLLGYYKNLVDTTICTDAYSMLIFANCTELVIEDMVLKGGSTDGLVLGYCSNSTIRNISIDSSRNGYFFYESFNCTVTNNIALSNIDRGFYLVSSDSCALQNNTANSNGIGFVLESSTSCTLTNNTARLNIEQGYYLSLSPCTLLNNTAGLNGNQGFYLSSSDSCILTDNTAISNSGYGFFLLNSDSCVLTNNSADSHGSSGFYLDLSSCTLTQNTASSNDYGFVFHLSTCTITENFASSCNFGFYIDSSISCVLLNNSANSGTFGFYLHFSDSCVLTNNTSSENENDGYYLDSSDNCILTDNQAISNTQQGFYLVSSSSCTLKNNTANSNHIGIHLNNSANCGVYYNILFDNTHNAQDNDGTTNVWDDGVFLGNYYSNYTGTGNHTIVGTTGSVDWYPYHTSAYFSVTIEHPSDIVYESSTTNHSILWYCADPYPSSYCIYQNNSVILSEVWNGTSLTISVDGFEVATYNFTLELYDSEGNYVSDTMFVIVRDTIAPSINHPADCSYECGITGNEIQWSGYDLHTDLYVIQRNGSIMRSGDWTGSTIYLNVDDLNVGLFNYTIFLYDESENWIADTILVSVHDTISPSINHPADSSYEYGTVGTKIYWSPSDLNPASYSVLRNGTSVESGTWLGSSITVAADGLAVGVYNYTVVLYDESENWIADTVLVTVHDTTSPTISHPDDVSYEYGSTGNQIIWDSDDLLPASYTILRNGTSIESNSWDGSSIIADIDGLEVATYNFTACVYDESGNSISDTVIVVVILSELPSIDSPADSSYECGAIGNEIIWTPNDLQPDSYIILKNGITVESDTWDGSSIIVDVDGLSVGIYNYTACVYDKSGNSASDTVMLEVIDTTSPTIDHPVDSLYEYGTTGNEITWHPVDLNSESYTLLRNDTVIRSGAWTDSPITIVIDGLDVGAYNYTICVYDESGNSVSDTVMVTVTGTGASTSAENTPLANPAVVGGIAIAAVGAVLVVAYVVRRYIKNK